MGESLDLNDLQKRVEETLPDAAVRVTTDGYYYSFDVISPAFSGMRPVGRQQMVYKALASLIADGSLHAVNIQARSPEEI